MLKKIVSAMIAASFIANTASAEMLGLKKIGTLSAPLNNAVTKTPAENIFTYDNQKFILLDTDDNRFFVMCEDFFGTQKIDLIHSSNACFAKFDINDEGNIAHWLNNDFLREGNAGKKLPDGIVKNIDYSHEWHTEPTNIDGFNTEYVTKAGVALLSFYEYEKYIEKFGNEAPEPKAASYYLRTANADGTSVQNALSASFRVIGTTVSPKASVAQYIRPVFYLNRDFFTSCKISDIGQNVIDALDKNFDYSDLSSLYSDSELSEYFEKPYVQNVEISGTTDIGKEIMVSYTYNGNTEHSSLISWYVSDFENGEYTKAAEGETLTIPENMKNKYIKASVTPKAEIGVYKQGDEVFSHAIGPVISLSDIINEIKSAHDEKAYDLIKANASVLNVDASLLTDENINEIIKYIKKSPIDEDKFKDIFYEALALYEVNFGDDFENALKSEYLGLDYEKLLALSSEEKENLYQELKKIKFNSAEELSREIEKQILPIVISKADIGDIADILYSYKNVLSVEFGEDDLYSVTLAGYMTAGEKYDSFTQLNDAISHNYAEVKNTIRNKETPLGYTLKQNRTAQTAPLEGAKYDTPVENIFKYKGSDYIVLDSIEKNGKKYFYVMTKDYFGRHAVDTSVSEEGRAFFDAADKNNIAYWLNTDFVSKGNGGKKLPEEIIENIDICHIWHTEPSNYPNYGSESMTVGPIGLLSNTEFYEYITRFGNDTDLRTSDGWYFRSSRSGSVTHTKMMLLSCFMVSGSTLERDAAFDAYVRPVFYLSEDFFKKYKLDSVGGNVEILINEFGDEIKTLYTQNEIKNIFESPKILSAELKGIPLIGKDAAIVYNYSSVFPESTVIVRWQQSGQKDSGFTDIDKTGKTITITSELKGKYIRACIIPKSSSKINSLGEEFVTEGFGPIYSENDIITVVNSADKTNILSVLEQFNPVLELDFEDIYDNDKEAVIEAIADKSYKNIEQLKEDVKGILFIQKINNASSDTIYDVLTSGSLDCERFKALSDKSKIYDEILNKGFTSYESFSNKFYKLVCMTEMESADRTTIKSILKYYDSYLNADISSLSEKQLEDTSTVILKGRYNDFDELNTAVTSAVGNAKSQNDTAIGGGGSGGSPSKSPKSVSASGAVYPSIITQEPVKIEQRFSDLGDALWAADMIEVLASKGIVSGVAEGVFAPNELLTREQFVTLAVKAFGYNNFEKSVEFYDVSDGMWYTPNIYAAYNAGAIYGVDENNFGIGRFITREQMAAILYRMVAKEGYVGNEISETEFYDSDSISEYAKAAVNALTNANVISGYTDWHFKPHENATRAMAAVVIYKILNLREGVTE